MATLTTSQPQDSPEVVPALPEAPASVNVHVTLAGRQVQVTLRDTDEQRLLARLEQLSQRFPAVEDTPQAPPQGWCPKHGIQMRLNHGAHGSWCSHKTAQGWCKGK